MRFSLSALVLLAAAPAAAVGQVVQPPFDSHYSVLQLGAIADVPGPYGGLIIKRDDPNTLLIGGAANNATGALYEVPLLRDANNRIIGFAGPGVRVADAPFNDGGINYGPGGVLFLAGWPVNVLHQILPGSSVVSSVIDLTPLGVEASISSLNFVPPGFPGAGRMKTTSYSGGEWNTFQLSPLTDGTFAVSGVTEVPASRLPGGPEGFAYVPPGSPEFNVPSMVLSEYQAGVVSAYELDGNGDPIVSTRRVFVTGVAGAEGACIDTLTGDYLFSSFGVNSVIVVQGFVPPTPPCVADYNNDGTRNGDDLADYIADYFDSVGVQPGFESPIAIPGGYAGTATAAFPGFSVPCALAPDVPSPNPWGANPDDYRIGGYKVNVGQNNGPCAAPNPDDLADYIAIFFLGCP
jgi:hypothetical protein